MHVMTSSCFNIIASLLRELYEFEKCTFKAASRDPDDVIDLKLHKNDACLTVNVCVKFKVITKNFTTDIFKKSILKSFQPAARGRCCNLWRHQTFFELPTIARHFYPEKQLHNFYHFLVTGHFRFWPVSIGSRGHVRSRTQNKMKTQSYLTQSRKQKSTVSFGWFDIDFQTFKQNTFKMTSRDRWWRHHDKFLLQPFLHHLPPMPFITENFVAIAL